MKQNQGSLASAVALSLSAALFNTGCRPEELCNQGSIQIRRAQDIGAHAPSVSSTVMYVEDINDFVRHWNSTDQLYISGNPPVSSAQIVDLQALLKDHPSWSVYLIDMCQDMEYLSKNLFSSTELKGYRAIDEALVRERFAHDDRKGGNIIYISFDEDQRERRFGFFPSSYYNQSHKLGDVWTENGHNIFQDATNILRNDKDVVGSVSHVIQSMEGIVETQDFIGNIFLGLAGLGSLFFAYYAIKNASRGSNAGVNGYVDAGGSCSSGGSGGGSGGW